MATRKSAPKDTTKLLTLSKTKANLIMKDINRVLKKHNFTGTVGTMTFDGEGPILCEHKLAARTRIVAGRLIIECAH